MTWPGERYLLRQMLARTGPASLFLTSTAPIREDLMDRTSPEPTVLTMTRGWRSCPRAGIARLQHLFVRPGRPIDGGHDDVS